MPQNQDIERLISLLGKLPGLGPRSAQRAALHMMKKKDLLLLPLAEALGAVATHVRECTTCGNFGTNEQCDICSDARRNMGQICVVGDVADLWAMERANAFSGRYHVLGGLLSALDGIGPEDLRIPRLIKRLSDEDVSEVILALNATVDGQTTGHYIADQLAAEGVQVTSLAQGVPIGGELDYLDEGTITTALAARKNV